MKPRFIIGTAIISVMLSTVSIAQQYSSLQTQREQVIKQYVHDLQQADIKNTLQLFASNGTVISTSRGKVDVNTFYNAFFPMIQSAKTELHQTFLNTIDSNHYAARFHFTYKLKDGEQGTGEYMDEFVFVNNSTKLSAVYMFENLKFG